MLSIDIIVGARPNFVKVAPILSALDNLGKNSRVTVRLVHTGQHYDERMSQVFFDQLKIRRPDVNLAAGSGTQALQTSAIMVAYEELLQTSKPDWCLVVGDVNSTFACAVVAKKAGVSVAHVEAGIRSYDDTMPEEINRKLTDAISDLFFTTTRQAANQLAAWGTPKKQIHFVGNVMIDSIVGNQSRFLPPVAFSDRGLTPQDYFLMTLHRPSNVDDDRKLNELVNAVSRSTKGFDVLFVLHPRVVEKIKKLDIDRSRMILLEPQPYLEFGYLAANAKGVITDSGGLSEECTFYKVPCITLRENTERPETVEIGSNVLVGNDLGLLSETIEAVIHGRSKKSGVPELWDGSAADRIAAVLVGLRCDS